MSQKLCRCCCPNTNLLVYILVVLFGVASWVDINGLWVELPILVQHLPEGWDLPSYMAVIIQVANVAPLVYTITSSIWPHRRIEVPVIYVIISVGAVSCLLLALFWDKTSSIAGTEHSTALLILQFFLALVDCTSSVAFLPFMSVFKPQYMIAYFIGEGFSGLIPSLVSLGQGAGSMRCVKASWPSNGTIESNSTDYAVNDTFQGDGLNVTSFIPEIQLVGLNGSSLSLSGTTPGFLASPTSSSLSSLSSAAVVPSYPVYQPPKFTVQTFFLFLMGLMIVSLASFLLLNYWSYCRAEYAAIRIDDIEDVEISLWHGQDENDSQPDMTTSATTSMTNSYLASAEVEIFDMSGNPAPKKIRAGLVGDYDYDIAASKSRAKIYSPNWRGRKSQCCHGNVTGNGNKSARGPTLIRNASSTSTTLSSSVSSSNLEDVKVEMKKLSCWKYALYLILIAWINALMCGVLPSIQTYSCLPYGIRPYHLAVTLASISNPVACFAALFFQMTSTKATVSMTFLGSLLSGYLVLTAATSPTPPLVNHNGGGLLVILSWVIVVFFLTYTKVSIGMVFRKEGRRALLWVGAFTQVGALIGALAIFFIINYHHLFQWANPCA